MPEKFWQVPFPCLACNVKPRKQRAAIAEDCQGRVCEPSVVTQTHAACSFAEAFVLFLFFLSLSSTQLLYCCIPLVMTELTAVMAAASTITLESRAKRHPPSSSNGFPASSKETPRGLTVYPGGFLRCWLAVKSYCTSISF